MNPLQLGTLERQQIAYFFHEEDFNIQEISLMYQISRFRVLQAVREYSHWYKEEQVNE